MAKKEVLTVAHWGGAHLLYLPFNLAISEGYFAEQGLEVVAYPAGNDQEVYREVKSAKADIGIGDPSFVADSKSKPTKVIATMVQTVCNYGVTPYAEIQPIHEAADCAALRFATYPRPATSHALLNSIKKRHLNFLKTMEIVETPIGEQMTALERAKAEIAVGIEPMISYAEHRGLRVVFSGKTFFSDFLFTGVYTLEQTINTRRQTLLAFLRGLQKALSECARSESIAIKVGTQMFSDLPKECIVNAIRRMRNDHAWPKQAVINPKAWQACLNLRRELGEIRERKGDNELLEQGLMFEVLGAGS